MSGRIAPVGRFTNILRGRRLNSRYTFMFVFMFNIGKNCCLPDVRLQQKNFNGTINSHSWSVVNVSFLLISLLSPSSFVLSQNILSSIS
ncbi:hypothetical protein AR158_c472L [Paramecium bursaria Chlorella virus AR158]|uniref:hypothetical protein n=1 Tax=Paramecium bursaria Chlorella virus AR158 TaxID=380598 RepID=UPI00015AA6F7|nr:hypothetical protein AR158_c472L [Paramecium bursaria Chlorella virus AR158]ABU44017.1 hypothetical protein AR158_c472L [Paramecium bursaria Chlorella virus AR158]